MEIVTARLRMRPLSPRDLEALVDMHGDPEVMVGSSGNAVPRSRQESADWLTQAMASGGTAAWYQTFRVEERGSDVFIGRCGIRPAPGTVDAEIAYAFTRAAWGRGIATEAAHAVVAWAAEAGLGRVVGRVLASNQASQRILEKLGMVRVAEEPTAVGSLLRYEMNLGSSRSG